MRDAPFESIGCTQLRFKSKSLPAPREGDVGRINGRKHSSFVAATDEYVPKGVKKSTRKLRVLRNYFSLEQEEVRFESNK